MTGVEREGRIQINPLDMSCVIASLQRQLTHAVAYGDNGDESAADKARFVIRVPLWRTAAHNVFKAKVKVTEKNK